jgi:hypothetical protein
MAQNKYLRNKLPPNASRGQKRLAEMLGNIFQSNGVAMTVVFEQPLLGISSEATEEMVDQYNVTGMSVDFFVKELNMAIEYQGQQHYIQSDDEKPGGFFVGQVARDTRKRAFLKDLDVNLIEIPHSVGDNFTEDDVKIRLGLC